MPDKHPNSERIGGPGASHENHKHPEKSKHHLHDDMRIDKSAVSGGGGELDAHHTHDPQMKGKGKDRRPSR
jgi:hypothetical protein